MIMVHSLIEKFVTNVVNPVAPCIYHSFPSTTNFLPLLLLGRAETVRIDKPHEGRSEVLMVLIIDLGIFSTPFIISHMKSVC